MIFARSFDGMNVSLFRLAATLAFLGVALGAFGAHALKTTLATNETTDVWKTAVLYHFIHALALLLLAVLPVTNRLAASFLVAGIVLFSGSLYLLALTNIRWLGAVTPIGGLCFLAGWLWLIIRPPT
ncbi:MAG TPA: DUF423 domain-containing protein [Chthoniobacterales bacterium]|jgi:uncharacterized membrane protein YgdD (TMEM256/DUF423 family)